VQQGEGGSERGAGFSSPACALHEVDPIYAGLDRPGGWLVLGAPLNSSGTPDGVARMPAALRAHGLAERLGARDGGDLDVAIGTPERDGATGIIGFADVLATLRTVRERVDEVLRAGERPLVLGGCCTVLIGIAVALCDVFDRVGLAFLDGHLDFYDGRSSPTGECADMGLAILAGIGPPALTGLAGPPPLLAPREIVAVGCRDEALATANGAPDPRRLAPEMELHDVAAVRVDPVRLGAEIAARLAERCGRFWLHLDLDILDETALPSVDYRMPGGLSWAELEALAGPLARSPRVVGADVTIYNPDLDPEGHDAERIVESLARIWTG
jgi:arginase